MAHFWFAWTLISDDVSNYKTYNYQIRKWWYFFHRLLLFFVDPFVSLIVRCVNPTSSLVGTMLGQALTKSTLYFTGLLGFWLCGNFGQDILALKTYFYFWMIVSRTLLDLSNRQPCSFLETTMWRKVMAHIWYPWTLVSDDVSSFCLKSFYLSVRHLSSFSMLKVWLSPTFAFESYPIHW